MIFFSFFGSVLGFTLDTDLVSTTTFWVNSIAIVTLFGTHSPVKHTQAIT